MQIRFAFVCEALIVSAMFGVRFMIHDSTEALAVLFQCIENMVDTMDEDLNFTKLIDVEWTRSVCEDQATKGVCHDVDGLHDALGLLRQMCKAALPNPGNEAIIMLSRVTSVVHRQYGQALKEQQERQKSE